MKTNPIIMVILLCAGLGAFIGCKKEETTTPAPATRITGASTAPEPPKPADPAQPAVSVPAATTAPAVAGETTDAVKSDAAPAQGILERARTLIAEGKYQEASTSLNQLGTGSLTPDQQKIIDGLKTQIQAALSKAAAGDAASALGGALGGKK
jgi:hypothetical protein